MGKETVAYMSQNHFATFNHLTFYQNFSHIITNFKIWAKLVLFHVLVILRDHSYSWLPAWWALWRLWWPLAGAAMFQCVYWYLQIGFFLVLFHCRILFVIKLTTITVTWKISMLIQSQFDIKFSLNKIWWLGLVPTPSTRFTCDVGYRMAKQLVR